MGRAGTCDDRHAGGATLLIATGRSGYMEAALAEAFDALRSARGGREVSLGK
jgi:hypothetical protein